MIFIPSGRESATRGRAQELGAFSGERGDLSAMVVVPGLPSRSPAPVGPPCWVGSPGSTAFAADQGRATS